MDIVTQKCFEKCHEDEEQHAGTALTVFVFCGVEPFVVGRTAPDPNERALHQARVRRKQGRRGSTRPQADNAPALSREAAPCERLYLMPGAERRPHQAEPCPGGTKQTAVAGGTVSVVSPPPCPWRSTRHRPANPAPSQLALIERTPPDAKGNEYECEQFDKQIKRIDAEGRRGGSSWRMEQLGRTAERQRMQCGAWAAGDKRNRHARRREAGGRRTLTT